MQTQNELTNRPPSCWVTSGILECDDIFRIVFSYLDIKDCYAVSHTCSYWLSFADEEFWKDKCTHSYKNDKRLNTIRPGAMPKITKYNRKQVKKMEKSQEKDIYWKKEAFLALKRHLAEEAIETSKHVGLRLAFCSTVHEANPPQRVRFCTHPPSSIIKLLEGHTNDRTTYYDTIQIVCTACETGCTLSSQSPVYRYDNYQSRRDKHAPDGKKDYLPHVHVFYGSILYKPIFTFKK